jgi:GSPII_E N-terminal domain.
MQGNFRFKNIGTILQERGIITPAELKEGLEHQKTSGLPLGQIFVNLGYISEEDLLNALGIQAKMELVDLEETPPPKEALHKIPGAIARLYHIVPIDFEYNTLTVATSDPLNFSILDDLRFMFNCNIKGKVATAKSIAEAIKNITEVKRRALMNCSRRSTRLSRIYPRAAKRSKISKQWRR